MRRDALERAHVGAFVQHRRGLHLAAAEDLGHRVDDERERDLLCRTTIHFVRGVETLFASPKRMRRSITGTTSSR